MIDAIILLSGGIDSTTALYWALNQGYSPLAITFDYNECLATERKYAKKIAEYAKIPIIEIPIKFLKQADSLRKEGLEVENAEKYPADYIPAKNLVFFSIAAHFAILYKAKVIIKGLIKTDFGKFPDNNIEYFKNLENLIGESIGRREIIPKIIFPLQNLEKEDIIKLAMDLHAPLELTWSCYEEEGDKGLCGKCRGCIERINGFRKLGIIDPYLQK